ncbi:hypothetical protein ASPVEDRAFT_820446 [Aspergillus versicolor CBS 583.65]|uniref:Uncharacterized protein n=1 Tax=Aspergillus versicolor CBS 583.65 TaxID=1036611 RepID=A0A1L9PTV5_ASPVE|nr:uncharacterized protein ASPVEDRAFT_820446 [Aspergillus versicolor CBS 583.65]OJJ04862.1 hypothetical protein ASPVEDRAFT_820446 [Aspergillus versicolor CBS 583.65]
MCPLWVDWIGGEVMRSAEMRDHLRNERNILCFETEAAGLMDNFPCLVIRGISDYADSHKNDFWQGYAAITSAAYAKDLLRVMNGGNVQNVEPVVAVIERFSQAVASIEDNVSAMRTIHDKEKKDKILSWLSPLTHSDEQTAHMDKRAANTGKWFLELTEFQELVNGSNVTVYCHGIPGGGKSSLVSLAIDYLYKLRRQREGLGIAYLFFSFDRGTMQSLPNLIAALAKQFAMQFPSLPQVVEEFYETHSSQQRRPSIRELILLLKQLINGFKTSIIVLDALDECMDSSETLGKFMQILFQLQNENKEMATNILATSRINHNIKTLFNKSPYIIEIRARDDDLREYLDAELETVQQDKLDGGLREQARDNIIRASDGMFLVARLSVNHVRTLPTKGHIRDAINNLSHGLHELDHLYSAALRRLENKGEHTRELAKHILAWIVHVKRPLVTEELQHALAIRPGTNALDRELISDYFSNIGHLQSVCEGLVEVDKHNNIRLAHHTTYEYFGRLQADWITTAESHVARMCLTYLSYEIFGRDVGSAELDGRAQLIEYPFYQYSAQYWGYHIRNAALDGSDLVLSFLTNKNKFRTSCEAMLSLKHPFHDEEIDELGLRDAPALHVAAWFGLEGSLQRLISLGSDPNTKDWRGGTPLIWAAIGSQQSTFSSLLGNDQVDVNACNLDGATALHEAVSQGQESMVQLLVERSDINVNQRDMFQATPLHLACMHNQVAVARIIASSGKAALNLRDCDGWTPLFLSVSNNDADTANVIIEAGGTEINFRDAHGLPPLVEAAYRCSNLVFDLLLKVDGVDVNFASARSGTALYAAAMLGREYIVTRLLNMPGIDVNPSEEILMTPLIVAILMGHVPIVRLLLDTGKIDVNDTSCSIRTPLMRAAAAGQEIITRLLLQEYHADATRQSTDGATAQTVARLHGHLSIANMLEDWIQSTRRPRTPANGAHLTGRLDNIDEEHRSSGPETYEERNDISQATSLCPIQKPDLTWELVRAILKGNTEDLEVLLNQGVGVDYSIDAHGTTLLMLAIIANQAAVAIILLENHADPNITDSRGTSPLHFALNTRNTQLAQILLKYGADPNARHGMGLTPLAAAIDFESAQMVTCLLDSGADPYECVFPGLPLLAFAIMLKNEEVAMALLSHDLVDLGLRNELNISLAVLALKQRRGPVFKKIFRALCSSGEGQVV